MRDDKKVLLLAGIMAFVLFSGGCRSKEMETEKTIVSTKAHQSETVMPEERNFGIVDGVDFTGNEMSEDIFTGYDLTLVNVWATFCNPCLEEMPDLNEIYGEYTKTGKSFQMVGVCMDAMTLTGIDESIFNSAKEIEKTLNLSYLNIVPGEALMSGALAGVSAVPTTFFVDSNGNIMDTVIGSRSKEAWIEIIDGFLE